MRTINAVRDSSERVVAAGREKIRARKRSRHRDTLLIQLGQVCLDERSGSAVGDVDGNINRLVARLLLLNEAAGDDGDDSEDPEVAEVEMASSVREGIGA